MDTATTATELSLPSVELAQRLAETVGFEQRLVGVKMAAMGGANPSPLYSLADVASFIKVDDYQRALHDNQATVGYIDPSALAAWLEEVLGDSELAEAVRQIASSGEVYGKIAMPIRELLESRVAQCLQVLDPPQEQQAACDPVEEDPRP